MARAGYAVGGGPYVDWGPQEGAVVTMSAPVVALTFLGVLIALLGLFAAGSVPLMIVGLVAIGVAGVLQVAASRRG